MRASLVLRPIPRRIAVAVALLLGTAAGAAAASPPPFEPDVWAVSLAVPDPAAAAAAYGQGLGFTTEREAPSGAWSVLTLGQARVVLRRGFEGTAAPGSPRVYLNLRVGDLEGASQRALAAGFRVQDGPEDIAIGRSIQLVDPGGNPVNLIDIEGDGMPAAAPPGVFNAGITVPDMQEAEAFFTRLGFAIFTRDYLPETLVFQRHGAIPLVLHPAEASTVAGDTGALILDVSDAKLAASSLRSRGFEGREIQRGHWSGGAAWILAAPAGRIEIVELPGSSNQPGAVPRTGGAGPEGRSDHSP